MRGVVAATPCSPPPLPFREGGGRAAPPPPPHLDHDGLARGAAAQQAALAVVAARGKVRGARRVGHLRRPGTSRPRAAREGGWPKQGGGEGARTRRAGAHAPPGCAGATRPTRCPLSCAACGSLPRPPGTPGPAPAPRCRQRPPHHPGRPPPLTRAAQRRAAAPPAAPAQRRPLLPAPPERHQRQSPALAAPLWARRPPLDALPLNQPAAAARRPPAACFARGAPGRLRRRRPRHQCWAPTRRQRQTACACSSTHGVWYKSWRSIERRA